MSFPNKIESVNFHTTSPATADYNCIAWAASIDSRVIWPDEDEQLGWPPNLPRVETLDAFIQFFGLLGYTDCANGSAEDGIEKVAIYMRDGKVTHAARQKTSGLWTSKMGPGVDADHSDPLVLANGIYGTPVHFMRRQRGVGLPLPELHPPPAAPPLLLNAAGAPLLPGPKR